MSPVFSQPSTRVSLVVFGSLKYPSKTLLPLTRISPSEAIRTSTPGNGNPTVPKWASPGRLNVAGAVVSEAIAFEDLDAQALEESKHVGGDGGRAADADLDLCEAERFADFSGDDSI